MKKSFLLKGMTAAVVALAVVGCSKETNLYDQNSKVEESAANFVNNVLGGRAVDANQTWSTAQKVMVNVESEMAGTLKIYTANPHGNVTAPLLTQTITVGKASYAVAKPAMWFASRTTELTSRLPPLFLPAQDAPLALLRLLL